MARRMGRLRTQTVSANVRQEEEIQLLKDFKARCMDSDGAQTEFIRAIGRWLKQASRPAPNYRLPASQGPQDTQGRD